MEPGHENFQFGERRAGAWTVGVCKDYERKLTIGPRDAASGRPGLRRSPRFAWSTFSISTL
jgi:hypothetical protein